MYKKLVVDPLIRAKHTELITEPVIVTVNEFNDKAVKEFTEQMEKAHDSGQPIIPVVIDSYGGQAYSLLNMMDVMKKASLPVYTIATGKAMSCGALLFGMGEKRFIAEKATLMLHEVSSMAWGKVEEIKADAKETDRLNELVFKLLARNCGHEDNYFLDLMHDKSHADWFLDAKEAKKHKLATSIGIPQLKVSVKVNYDFS